MPVKAGIDDFGHDFLMLDKRNIVKKYPKERCESGFVQFMGNTKNVDALERLVGVTTAANELLSKGFAS